MCTLAWGQADGSIWACFNRDEQRSRPLADEPCIHQENGQSLIYARDPEGGGTWFAVSCVGFAVALLNHYPDGWRVETAPLKSRGQLVLHLVRADSPGDAMTRMEGLNLTAFAPFCLFVLSHGNVHARTWDGGILEEARVEMPFWTTSSYRPDDVAAWRREWWNGQANDQHSGIEATARLMRMTNPDNPACGLTMDREDARTLSQIEWIFSNGKTRLTYRQREPEGLGYLPPITLSYPA